MGLFYQSFNMVDRTGPHTPVKMAGFWKVKKKRNYDKSCQNFPTVNMKLQSIQIKRKVIRNLF